jgi:hypothetical protein
VTSIDKAEVALTGLNFFAGDLAGPDYGVLSIPGRSAWFRENVPVAVRIGERLGVLNFNVKVAEGLGCKAIRVFQPDKILPALEAAKKLADEFRVPVVVEIMLERVTDIAMGTDLDNIVEFEALAEVPADAPTHVSAAAAP